jgi:hypothetical protein
MSNSGPPMCSVCLSAHWLGREPHVFGKAKVEKAAPAKPPKKKAAKKK